MKQTELDIKIRCQLKEKKKRSFLNELLLEFSSLIILTFLLYSSAYDAYDLDDAHDCGQGPETKDDCGHLCISQWEAPKCDQMGHQVEGWIHFAWTPRPKWDGDSVEQLYGDTEPWDPQTEAHMYRDLSKREDHRQRGAQCAM